MSTLQEVLAQFNGRSVTEELMEEFVTAVNTWGKENNSIVYPVAVGEAVDDGSGMVQINVTFQYGIK